MSSIVVTQSETSKHIMPWQDLGPRTQQVAFEGGVSILFCGHLVHTPTGKVALVLGWGMEASVEGWQWLTIADQVRELDRHLPDVIDRWKALTMASLNVVFEVAQQAHSQVRVRSRK